jgi:hypothetical protein
MVGNISHLHLCPPVLIFSIYTVGVVYASMQFVLPDSYLCPV